jgi:Phytanoyl-CoA dioxygenase (PhyH)
LLRAWASQMSKPNFSSEGFVILEGVLDERVLRDVRAGIETMLEEAHRDPLWRAGGTLHVDGLIERGAPFDVAWKNERVRDAAASLLGGEFETTRAHFRSPLPGNGAQALHADYPNTPADRVWQVATAIVAIDEFTSQNGATRVVPGSHLVPRIDVPREHDTPHAREQIVTMAPGSVLFFNGHLWHSGTRNRSQARRDALQISFVRPGAMVYR